MTHATIAIIVAAIAGGLAVYLHFATKPETYDRPVDIIVGGVSLQQVAGAGGRRRVLVAWGALLACLVFLAGSLSTLIG